MLLGPFLRGRIKNFLRDASPIARVFSTRLGPCRAAQEGKRKKVVQWTIRTTVKFISASWIPKIAHLSFLPHRADVGMLRRSNLIIFMQRVCAGSVPPFSSDSGRWISRVLYYVAFFSRRRGVRGIKVPVEQDFSELRKLQRGCISAHGIKYLNTVTRTFIRAI